MKNWLFSLLLSIFTISAFGQQYNRPTPEGVFPYDYTNNGLTGDGYFFATLVKLYVQAGQQNYIPPQTALFDYDGYLAWYAKPGHPNVSDFKYYPSGNMYSYAAWSVWNQGVTFYILDDGLNYIDSLNVTTYEEDIHDIQRAENGNWLLAARFHDTLDLSAYTFDGTQGSVNTVIRGFGVQEIDANGNVIFEWNSNDHIHPSETYDFYGYNVNDFDYAHGNAIEEDVDGHLLFSMRHLNAVYKVHRTTGDIIWQLGGQSSDFSFVNDSGFSAQHDIRRLANGNYTLYDNDNMGSNPRSSRGVEYTLDTVNWTATKVYEFEHPDINYHRAMGSFRTMNDGKRVLGWGFSRRPKPSATIVDQQQNILSEFHFADSVVSYRTLYDTTITLPRPEIICQETTNGFELSVASAAGYEWSTGETTQTIEITTPGTYMVWVPYGEGFVGSIPFEVTDVNDPCGSLSLPQLTLEKGAFKLFDLLGRPVVLPIPNEVYLKVWESGSVEKTIFTAD